ncbi:MAG: hypothetical protein KAT30_16155, partial [Candidatus Krumholzibacteria bacterium]|nr:hypothetical protein [Candidatus Krumholzibacteria bacterium]
YGIMNSDPDPVSSHRSGLPEGVRSVIDRSLQKDLAERYQNATDLLADLDRLRAGRVSQRHDPSARGKPLRRFLMTAGVAIVIVILGIATYDRFLKRDQILKPPERKMIAVLPFENLGPAEDEYFADGVTDEIIARLAGIHSLGVIARTSVMQYKHTQKTIQQIGEELGVEYVLEGTVRWQHSREGRSRVRVTPQLIHVADATHLWADVYDETIAEIFHVQSRIAQEVSQQLNIALGDAEARVVQAEPTDDFEAYTYFLRGREHRLRSYSLHACTQAERWYKKAIELDPEFALAWAELAIVRDMMWWEFYRSNDERASEARKAAETALRLDPELSEAHIAMAKCYYHQLLDYDRALGYLEYALERKPGSPDVLYATGIVQRRKGMWLMAVENLRKACELDPHSAVRAGDLASTYAMLRQYDEAIRYYDRTWTLAQEDTMSSIVCCSAKACLVVLGGRDLTIARGLIEELWQRFDKKTIQEALTHYELLQILLTIELIDGEYATALEVLESYFPEAVNSHWAIYPTTQLYGDAYEVMGRTDRALAYYDSARVYLENKMAEDPGDARVHSSLGYVYARLGRKNEAVKTAEWAVQLMPTSKDAVRGPRHVLDLARTY